MDYLKQPHQMILKITSNLNIYVFNNRSINTFNKCIKCVVKIKSTLINHIEK